MKKKLAVAMAITAGLCFAGSGHLKPAFAGYWEVVPNQYLDQYGMAPPPFDPSYANYLGEDAKRVDGSVGISPNYTDNWHEGYPALNGGFEGQPIFASTTPGNTLIVSSIGKRKLFFHWVQNQINGQDDPSDNPPAELHIEVYVQAAATLDNIIAYLNTNLETSVGIDQGVSYSGTIGAPGAPAYSPNYTYSYIGKWIPITIQTNGHKDVESPWITFDAKSVGDLKPYAYGGDGGSVELGFDWDYDTRAAYISSNIEPTHYKDENGEPKPHTRNANGSMTIDTVAAWSGENWYWENGSLSAILSGAWNQPQYVWGSDDSTGTQNASVVYPFFPLGGTSEASGPATKTVHVGLAVTDDDTRVINNSYTMVFHAPTENEHVYKTEDEDPDHFLKAEDKPYDLVVNSNPPYAHMGAGVPCTITNTPYWAVVNSDQTKGAVNVIGGLTLPDVPLATIAALTGIAITEFAPKQWNETPNYNVCWTSDYSTWDDSSTRPSSINDHYDMSPKIAISHRLKYINYDAYGTDGYDGKKRTVTETISGIQYYGKYTTINP